MTTICQFNSDYRENQFGLAALLEFMTLCAVLAALSPATGLPASVLLMLMTLALAARQGLLTLVAFAASCLAADCSITAPPPALLWSRGLAVILVAASLCLWFRLRRKASVAA